MAKGWSGRWDALTGRSGLAQFVDSLLRGYAQILFCQHPLIGLLFIAAFSLHPGSGAQGLLGALAASATAWALQTPRPLFRTGLFATNGALVGLSWAFFLRPTLPLMALLALTSAFSALVLLALMELLTRRFQLPALSLSFVLVTWGSFLALHRLPEAALWGYGYESTLPGVEMVEGYLRATLPALPALLLRFMSAIFFQDSLLIGLLCFLGLFLQSRLSALFAVLGGYGGALVFFALGNPEESLGLVVSGFNAALIGVALGSYFLALNWQSLLYALLAVAVGGVVSAALFVLLKLFLLPPLAGPFNLVTLLFLILPRTGVVDQRRTGLALIPLELLGSPNAVLQWQGPGEGWRRGAKTALSLPFYGTWYVSQGNHGHPTHWGHGSYAWDFVVLGADNRSHRGVGRRCSDYHAYGLPIIAPAPGQVVAVVADMPDNFPPMVGEDHNWGNFVIIDHGNGEYSELSHFMEKGIVVKVGDPVARGQLLGYCGNSGLSEEPHLHYQLQAGDFVGARSLPARFSDYVKLDGDRDTLVKRGIPQRGDRVRNREAPASLLAGEAQD